MIIGFGNGVYHKKYETEYDRFKPYFINRFAHPKANTIEIHLLNTQHIDYLIENPLNLDHFKYKSIHTPVLTYEDNQFFENLLQKLRKLVNTYEIFNIVIHPDQVKNWNIFNKFDDLPISLENMDFFKKSGQTIKELMPIMNSHDFNLTLDLQHCYMIDNSMQLAKDFHKTFKDRIVEYHISGYHEKYIHYPLFKTKQNEILEAIEIKDIPIIIESVFYNMEEHLKEITYILDILE